MAYPWTSMMVSSISTRTRSLIPSTTGVDALRAVKNLKATTSNWRTWANSEGAQEGAQCRGRVWPVEDLTHGAVALQCHVVNAVVFSDQRHHLAAGMGALVARYAQMVVSKAGQPGVLGKLGDRYQSCGRHQIRIVEDRCCGWEPVRQFHLRDALRNK
jgi:hypothetical protein